MKGWIFRIGHYLTLGRGSHQKIASEKEMERMKRNAPPPQHICLFQFPLLKIGRAIQDFRVMHWEPKDYESVKGVTERSDGLS